MRKLNVLTPGCEIKIDYGTQTTSLERCHTSSPRGGDVSRITENCCYGNATETTRNDSQRQGRGCVCMDII